jgi:WhiB family redox-sensing transcriptional regulator
VTHFLDLLEGLRVESWMAKGSCADSSDPDAWFPQAGGHPARTRRARRICGSCPVREACLRYAMQQPPARRVVGIWGGLTAEDRKTLRNRKRHSA